MTLKDIKVGQKFIFVSDTKMENYELDAVPVYILRRVNGFGYLFERLLDGDQVLGSGNDDILQLPVVPLEF